MHPDATDSSGAGLGPAPAVGAPGERRPEPREDAAAPRGPGGGSWWVPVAVAALAAASLSYLGPGCWRGAGGAGPCAVLLGLSLYLGCAAAAFLLGTLLSLVCRSRRAPPPDFAAAWSRLAARRRPGVSTGLLRLARPASARPSRFRCPPPALGRGGRGGARPLPPGEGQRAVPRPAGAGSGLRGRRRCALLGGVVALGPSSVSADPVERPPRALGAAPRLVRGGSRVWRALCAGAAPGGGRYARFCARGSREGDLRTFFGGGARLRESPARRRHSRSPSPAGPRAPSTGTACPHHVEK